MKTLRYGKNVFDMYEGFDELDSLMLADIPEHSSIAVTSEGWENLEIKKDGLHWTGEIKFRTENHYDIKAMIDQRVKFIGDVHCGNEPFIALVKLENMSIKAAIRHSWDIATVIFDMAQANSDNRLSSSLEAEFVDKASLYSRAIKKIINEIENFRDTEENTKKIIDVTGRLKEFKIFSDKCILKGLSEYEVFEKIEDIAGVRAVCEYLSDAYELRDYLYNHPELRVKGKIDDKILNPTAEGYRGLHITFMVKIYYKGEYKEVPVETQIRTAYGNSWAMKTHDLTYKKASDIPDSLLRQMELLSELLYNADKQTEILRNEIRKHNPKDDKLTDTYRLLW